MTLDLLTFADELRIFLAVGRQLRVGAGSIRSIEHQVSYSTASIFKSIDRLEHHYGGMKLITRAKGRAGETALTPHGEKLLDRLEDLYGWQNGFTAKFRMAVSNYLVTSGILASSLSTFLSQRLSYEFEVSLRSDFSLEKALPELRDHELDAILAWDDLHRPYDTTTSSTHFWSVKPIGTPFDVVVVSSSLDFLREHFSSNRSVTSERLRCLADKRVAIISEQRQPLYDQLPAPDRSRGGLHVRAHTYDEVIALITSGIAFAGIVPGVYASLNRFRKSGQLFYSHPVDSIRALLYARSPIETTTCGDQKPLFDVVEYSLENDRGSPIYDELDEQPIPFDPSVILKIKYGYYVDHQRSDASKHLHGILPLWKEEHIKVFRNVDKDVTARESSELGFSGSIDNCHGDSFAFTAVLYTEGVLLVRAVVDGSGSSNSVPGFATILTCHRRDLPGVTVLCGTWVGKSDLNHPSNYATIWSSRPLTIREIHAICDQTSANSLVGSRRGPLLQVPPSPVSVD